MASNAASYGDGLGVAGPAGDGVGRGDGRAVGVGVAVGIGVRVGSTDGNPVSDGVATAIGAPDPGWTEHAATRITRAATATERACSTAGV
jgi:hypothetical protein